MVGAACCFYIARYLGIERMTRLISQPAVDKTNAFVEKYGTYAILIARLIPFISFDVVSYFAGATRMRFLGFLDCDWHRSNAGYVGLFLSWGQNLCKHQTDVMEFLYLNFDINYNMACENAQTFR